MIGLSLLCPRFLMWVLLVLAALVAGILAVRAVPAHIEQHPPVPPPADATFLAAGDGTRLFFEIGGLVQPRAVVWIVQGNGAQATAPFPTLTATLRESGIAVATMHPRGTGYSDGPRGDVERFEWLLEDEHSFARALRTRFPAVPIVLLGHSAGAAYALDVAARSGGDTRFSAIVLVNPAVKRRAGGVGPSPREMAIYAAHVLIRPSVPIADMNGDPSRLRDPDDRRDAERAQADPLRVPRYSMRFLLGLRRLMNASVARAHDLDLPLLAICGENDDIIDPSSCEELARAWRGQVAEVRRVPGGHGVAVVERHAGVIRDFVAGTCF